jgi:hypothetical protein
MLFSEGKAKFFLLSFLPALKRPNKNVGILKMCHTKPWSQSYDRELQRQRCNFLQRHG